MQQTTSRDGTTIGFRRSGSGPPLLLVHGTTADHTRWATVLEGLEQHFTVFAMDRRGRGASSDGPVYSVYREAEDVAAVVDAIGGPTNVLGHSYGGVCSLEAALLTDGITRLILYEPPIPTGLPFFPPKTPERMQALLDQGELEAALEIMFREIVGMPDDEFEMYRKLPAWQARIQLAPTLPREITYDRGYEFVPERFANLHIPTLLLLGGDSPALFVRGTEAVDAALPDSRVDVMPGQQHIAMDTDPAMFIEEVVTFLGA